MTTLPSRRTTRTVVERTRCFIMLKLLVYRERNWAWPDAVRQAAALWRFGISILFLGGAGELGLFGPVKHGPAIRSRVEELHGPLGCFQVFEIRVGGQQDRASGLGTGDDPCIVRFEFTRSPSFAGRLLNIIDDGWVARGTPASARPSQAVDVIDYLPKLLACRRFYSRA